MAIGQKHGLPVLTVEDIVMYRQKIQEGAA
jgi:3,4-dihydroxy-2-butanone 4-phosphate synthase